ncbi:hypothetical protein Trihar35433_10158 [Trichoderma harzianum]|nr:hypothetical protein Trihar35433_10158 [Trichoderma harzianum]
MDDAKKYLSDRLLSEEVPSQNASKADSIHATYLIYGSKTEHKQPETGDTDMDNSVPEPEPLSDYAPTKTVTIVAEENLKGLNALAEYEEVTSFHIYSLAPFPQRDLALLSDVSKSLSEYRKIEDAAKTLDTYGIIANPQARRKDRKGRPPVPAPAPSASAPKSVKQEVPPTLSKPTQPEKVKQEVKEVSSAEATPSSSAGKKPPATLKRGASGGIMQSFAKAAAKPPKPKPEPKPKEEDTSMALSDDGEADDEDLPTSKKSIDLEALKRTRKQREEELMRMMEDADDDIKEAKKEDEQSDEEMEEASEAEPEPEPEPEQQPKEEKEPTEVVSNSGDGRRRGKRRVMKKKRILDDQGYMVTIQEAAWESFSEDEAPPPTATKPKPASTPAASSTQKSKKAAAPKNGSQGSIMSFFGKK